MSSSQKKIQEIYCDESGFTGNNLLDEATPFFAYATVAVSHEEAKEFVEGVIKDYRVQSGELKFQRLIRYSRGREAITHVLSKFSHRSKVTINHKKFNLACKFYEYIFEPTIASKNSIFYNLNFHRFISNLLYLHFEQKHEYAEKIFEDFYNLMKIKDSDGLLYLFNSTTLPSISPALDIVRTFCIHQQDVVNEELESLKGTDVGKWILDLTQSSLVSLLSEWGEEYDQLRVFCDASKPLQEQTEIYQAMVNKEEKISMELAGEEHAITFNLADVPQLVNSQSHPGIQIADILAGTFTFIFRENSKGNYSNYPEVWKSCLVDCVSRYSVVPDFDHLDFEELNVKRNYLILQELTNRSIKGISLLDDIEVFLAEVTHYLYLHPTK
jgi:Protein of unknown function (DUF3800)